MDTLQWRRRQRRLTIVDRLATDEPGSLSSCSFSDLGEAIYDLNNNSNDPEMLSYFLSDYVEQFWPYMLETNNNDGEQFPKRQLRLSELLEGPERTSIREFVGNNAALLSSGVCQLLQEVDGLWTLYGIGVICFIRDYNNKLFSLNLVDPNPDGAPAHVIWMTTVPRDFHTVKGHSHLLTFEIKSGLFGLNFHEAREATDFHEMVMQSRLEYLSKKSMRRGPKRMAPPPPTTQNNVSLDPVHVAEETTSYGIEIPVVREEKKKKKGLLTKFSDKIFGEKEKKSKKEKGRPTISQPTNFQHVQHGLEDLNEEQKEILKRLMLNGIKIEPGNKEQLKYLLVDKFEELKGLGLEETKETEKTGERDVEHGHPPFQRTTSNGLSDTRSSIMISKTGKGNKPRDIKKQSNNRRESQNDPLRPNWDEEFPPFAPPTVVPVVEAVEVPPALPSRTASRRVPFNRQNTPPHPRLGPPDELPPPRLPPRLESARRDVPVHSTPPRPPSPPLPVQKIPPPPLSTTAPPAPPPPPPNLLPKVNPPANIPAPPPPPPMSSVSIRVDPPSGSPESAGTMSSAVPAISAGRRSLLDEIASVNKAKLLRPVDRSPSRSDASPTQSKGLGIIDSIQRELDLRRTMINDSSDDESSSDEDSESWSD